MNKWLRLLYPIVIMSTFEFWNVSVHRFKFEKETRKGFENEFEKGILMRSNRIRDQAGVEIRSSQLGASGT